jgi:hypothetical protein
MCFVGVHKRARSADRVLFCLPAQWSRKWQRWLYEFGAPLRLRFELLVKRGSAFNHQIRQRIGGRNSLKVDSPLPYQTNTLHRHHSSRSAIQPFSPSIMAIGCHGRPSAAYFQTVSSVQSLVISSSNRPSLRTYGGGPRGGSRALVFHRTALRAHHEEPGTATRYASGCIAPVGPRSGFAGASERKGRFRWSCTAPETQ